MDIEIRDCTEYGWKFFECGSWGIGTLNTCPDVVELRKLERHLESDEVFVLLKGHVTLYIGKELKKVEMEPLKSYRIPKGLWHANIFSKDSTMLVCENSDVTEKNSEYIYFNDPSEIPQD